MKILYKPANVRGLGPAFQLKPGENDVPDNVWNAYKDHPHIKRLIESKDIEELSPASQAPAKATPPAEPPKPASSGSGGMLEALKK